MNTTIGAATTTITTCVFYVNRIFWADGKQLALIKATSVTHEYCISHAETHLVQVLEASFVFLISF